MKMFDMTSKIEDVKFIGAVDQGGAAMGLCFQVTDVRKPLVAVKRIAENFSLAQIILLNRGCLGIRSF